MKLFKDLYSTTQLKQKTQELVEHIYGPALHVGNAYQFLFDQVGYLPTHVHTVDGELPDCPCCEAHDWYIRMFKRKAYREGDGMINGRLALKRSFERDRCESRHGHLSCMQCGEQLFIKLKRPPIIQL